MGRLDAGRDVGVRLEAYAYSAYEETPCWCKGEVTDYGDGNVAGFIVE